MQHYFFAQDFLRTYNRFISYKRGRRELTEVQLAAFACNKKDKAQ